MTAEAAPAGEFNMTIRALRHQPRATTALVIATAALSLLANGCASLVNTPAQDVAWNRWKICHTQATGTEIRNRAIGRSHRVLVLRAGRPPSHA